MAGYCAVHPPSLLITLGSAPFSFAATLGGRGELSPSLQLTFLRDFPAEGDFGGVEPPKSRGTLPKILSRGIFGSVPLRVCSFDCSNAVKGKFLLAQLARFWRRRAAKIVRGKLLFSLTNRKISTPADFVIFV